MGKIHLIVQVCLWDETLGASHCVVLKYHNVPCIFVSISNVTHCFRYFSPSQGTSPVSKSRNSTKNVSPKKSPVSSKHRKNRHSDSGQPNIVNMFAEQQKCAVKKEKQETDDLIHMYKDDSLKETSTQKGNRSPSKKSSKGLSLDKKQKHFGGSSAFMWSKFKFSPRQESNVAKQNNPMSQPQLKSSPSDKEIESNQTDIDEAIACEDFNKEIDKPSDKKTDDSIPNKCNKLLSLSKDRSSSLKASVSSYFSSTSSRSQDAKESVTDSDVIPVQSVEYGDFLNSAAIHNDTKSGECDRLAELSSQDSDTLTDTSKL